MDTQKNLMMFTIIVGLIFGVWFLFAPNSYNAVMGVDLSEVSEVSDIALGNQMNIGVSLLILSYVNWILRSLTEIENCEKIMNTFCIGWGLFGLGGLYIVGGDFAFSNPFTIQSIVFLIISGVYFAMRTPKKS